jgi:periplasmic protein CpxP/Spy
VKKTFKLLLVSSLLAGAGFTAMAQGMPHDEHGMDHKGRMDPARMEQMVNKHLADLKTRLKLTPAQEGAWTTFAAAMKPTGIAMGQQPERAELDKLPTPERIDKMRAFHKQHMADMDAAMEKRDAATKTFYASLSAEQKTTFDAEHARMGSHRMGQPGTEHAKPGVTAKP